MLVDVGVRDGRLHLHEALALCYHSLDGCRVFRFALERERREKEVRGGNVNISHKV